MPENASAIHVLVVDDCPDTLHLQAIVLRKRGYLVATAATAAAAIEAGAAEPVDVLISDIRLPDRSGLELIHELRRHHPALRGIALTGDGDAQLIDACHRAGFSYVLVKPIPPEKLLETVAAAGTDTPLRP